MRDPFVEAASEQLEAIFSRAQRLTQKWFRGVEKDPNSFRITTLAVMKMLVSLTTLESTLPTPRIPEFNPDELMQHKWLGKRKSAGEGYQRGSKSFGWDYKDQFSEDVLKALEQGPITINEYCFTLTDRIVQAKKVKK